MKNATIYGNEYLFSEGALLSLEYRPCTPKNWTEENKNETCLFNASEPDALEKQLQKSKDYVGDALIEILFN